MSGDPLRAAPREAEADRPSVGKYGLFLVKFVISVSLVAYLLSRLDVRLPPMTAGVVALFGVCILLLLLQPLVMSLRWWLLLRASSLRLTLRETARVNWISIFANQFLPASLGGDAVRILLSRMCGLSIKAVTMTVVFDRGFALLALFLLILLLAPAVSDVIETRAVTAFAAATCVAGLAALFSIGPLAPRAGRLLAARPRLAFLEHYVNRVAELASNRSVVAAALGLSAAVHLLSFAALSTLAYCFSVDVPWLDLVAINSLITLAHILPVSVAGWGVREGAAVLLLGHAGVDSSTALSISLLAGAAFAIASLPGAVLWFVRPGR
jgi:uncharacterized membrane protein YbhN (UPF0104 family)